MPTFLPPTAASSEVVRTLNLKTDAEKAHEARKADVEIAGEEIRTAKSAVSAQEATLQLAESMRHDLELQLQTAQYMTSYFTQSAQLRESQITDHLLQIQLLEDNLKARQKDIRTAEQNRINAIEARDAAKRKLDSAKTEHDKAFEVAKARGLLPDLPGPPDASAEKRKSKSPDRQRSKDRGSGRRRSRSRSPRSRSPLHRQPDRRRSRSRDRLPIRDRRRPSPVGRRRDIGRRFSPVRPRFRSPIGRRGPPPPPRRRSPQPGFRSLKRPRSRSHGRRSPTPDRKRQRDPSPRRREKEKGKSPEAEKSRDKSKPTSSEKPTKKVEESLKDKSAEKEVHPHSRDEKEGRVDKEVTGSQKLEVPTKKDDVESGQKSKINDSDKADELLEKVKESGDSNAEPQLGQNGDAKKVGSIEKEKPKKEKKEKKEKHKKEKKEKKDSKKEKVKAEKKSSPVQNTDS